MPTAVDPLKAVRDGNVGELQLLIQQGLDVSQSSLLTEACSNHKLRVVELLLDYGADAAKAGPGEWTPLHHACTGQDDPAIVTVLLAAGATVDSVNAGQHTPLFTAAQRGFSKAVITLLEAGATTTLVDMSKRTALHIAAAQGSRECVASLLGYGACVHSRDVERETPLHKAVRGGHHLAAAVLLKAGADAAALNCWGELAGSLAKGYKVSCSGCYICYAEAASPPPI